MDHAAFMKFAEQAPEVHSQIHENTARAIKAQAPQAVQGMLQDMINRARSLPIPITWRQIMAALTIAALGGFTPEAIMAAFASFFNTPPAPTPVPAPAG